MMSDEDRKVGGRKKTFTHGPPLEVLAGSRSAVLRSLRELKERLYTENYVRRLDATLQQHAIQRRH